MTTTEFLAWVETHGQPRHGGNSRYRIDRRAPLIRLVDAISTVRSVTEKQWPDVTAEEHVIYLGGIVDVGLLSVELLESLLELGVHYSEEQERFAMFV